MTPRPWHVERFATFPEYLVAATRARILRTLICYDHTPLGWELWTWLDNSQTTINVEGR